MGVSIGVDIGGTKVLADADGVVLGNVRLATPGRSTSPQVVESTIVEAVTSLETSLGVDADVVGIGAAGSSTPRGPSRSPRTCPGVTSRWRRRCRRDCAGRWWWTTTRTRPPGGGPLGAARPFRHVLCRRSAPRSSRTAPSSEAPTGWRASSGTCGWSPVGTAARRGRPRPAHRSAGHPGLPDRRRRRRGAAARDRRLAGGRVGRSGRGVGPRGRGDRRGVSDADELLLDPARSALARTLTGRGFRPVPPVLRAALGPEAGFIGAADLARELVGHR